MFKLRQRTRRWVFVGLAACAVFLAGANPQIGEARPLLATSPTLGSAGTFAVLGGSTVTNVPAAGTLVVGNLGVWPGSAITGFPPGIVVAPGTIHAGDAVAQTAQTDVTTAYNALDAAANANANCIPPYLFGTGNKDLVGANLVPGVYCADTFTLSGTLTLSGSGVWVFKSGATLITSGTANVVGGDACNVWWRVPSSATLGTNTSLIGNILALTSITLNHGANITSGRALARNGAVTMDDNTVDASACSGVTPSAPSAPKEVPEADTMLLFGGGIGGLATWLGWQWRKTRSRVK